MVKGMANAYKCRVMHMGYNNKLAEYHMNDVKLAYGVLTVRRI